MEAAEWVVRLSEPHSQAEADAFQAWLEADLAHEIAFEQSQRTWDRASSLGSAGEVGRALSTLGFPAASPIRTEPRLSRRHMLGGGIAAAALLTIGGGSALILTPPSTAYASTRGQRLTAPLEGGGQVELNTLSRLAISSRFGRRRIELVEGEGLFDLPPAQAARCTVVAGKARIATQGARFCLRRDQAGLRLTVLDGSVNLDAPGVRRDIGAGILAEVDGRGLTLRTAEAAELDRALSWRAGGISLAGETLAWAAAEFNRYNELRIRIGDPSIAGLKVGGYFDANDPTAFAHAVAGAFGLRVRPGKGELVIEKI